MCVYVGVTVLFKTQGDTLLRDIFALVFKTITLYIWYIYFCSMANEFAKYQSASS